MENQSCPHPISRGSLTADYLLIFVILHLCLWSALLYLWRNIYPNATVRIFSNLMVGLNSIPAAALVLMELITLLGNDDPPSDVQIDLIVVVCCMLMNTYILEITVRSSETRKPSRLIVAHHYVSIMLILVTVGRTYPPKFFGGPESFTYYVRIAVIMAIVATFDFVGELGFLLYRIWSKSNPARVILVLKVLFVYGITIRIVAHILFFVFFSIYMANDRLKGGAKWLYLVCQLAFVVLEYYYTFVLLVLIKRLRRKYEAMGAIVKIDSEDRFDGGKPAAFCPGKSFDKFKALEKT